MTGPVAAVTLDAHGVLVLPDPTALRNVLEPLGCQVDDERCWRAHYEMTALLDEMDKVDFEHLNRAFAIALGVRPEDQDFAAPLLRDVYLSTAWLPAPGAADGVRTLIELGFRVGVISNTVHGDIEGVLARAGICEVGHHEASVAIVLDSAVVGVRKPDPSIFRHALDALGTSAEQATHLGDSLKDDVIACQAVGMHAIHVDPLGSCERRDHDHTASLAEWVGTLS